MLQMNQTAAKEKRKASQKETEKMQMLNLNKWELVRAKREELLEQQRQVKLKLDFLKKWTANIVLNGLTRKLNNDFTDLKKKVERYNKIYLRNI